MEVQIFLLQVFLALSHPLLSLLIIGFSKLVQRITYPLTLILSRLLLLNSYDENALVLLGNRSVIPVTHFLRTDLNIGSFALKLSNHLYAPQLKKTYSQLDSYAKTTMFMLDFFLIISL